MPNAIMLLSNPFRPDPRVFKEAEYLQQNGYSISILCWDRNSEFPAEEALPSGVKVIRIQKISSGYGIGLRQLSRLPRFWLSVQHQLPKFQPAIIHCHDFDTLPAGLWYGLLHRIPIIYDAHEYYAELVRPRLHGWLGKLVYSLIRLFEQLGSRMVKAVVTVDETLATIYGKHNPTVIVLGHYPEKNKANQRNPIFTHPNLFLLYAGRLSVDRGLLIYADILRMLIGENIPARLHLAGVFTPESERSTFNDYTKGIEKYISYLGWIPYGQISDVYHQADIGLSILLPEPRYVAALPVKLFEYMANGLPVIASNFPAIAKIVNEANCGVLVDSAGEPSDTVNIIKSWWQNHNIPVELGENGRQAILSKYNWENQAGKLVDLYRSLA